MGFLSANEARLACTPQIARQVRFGPGVFKLSMISSLEVRAHNCQVTMTASAAELSFRQALGTHVHLEKAWRQC